MNINFLSKKKKRKNIAPPSGIFDNYESVDAEGSDGWKVIDHEDEIYNNLKKEEKETALKKPKLKKKISSKKKLPPKKNLLSKKKKTT